MSSIYQKTVSDKTCILAPREYFIREFDFEDWTEMRFGMFLSAVTSGGDDTINTAETVAISTVADRMTIGLKDAATTILPGVAGSSFLGVITGTSASSSSFAGSGFGCAGSPVNAPSAAGYNGATLIGGTSAQVLGDYVKAQNASSATGYCGFYGLKFVITNRGLASQSVAISSFSNIAIAGADYSASALRTLINNSIYGTAASIAWNDGVAAYDIPDALWIRMPFYNNRIRLSSIMGVRYAP